MFNRISFSIITILTCTQHSIAQDSQPALAAVKYIFSHVTDSNHRDVRYTENKVLYLGASATLFRTYRKEASENKLRREAENAGFEGPHQFDSIVAPGNSNLAFYCYSKEKKLYRTARMLATEYLFDENYPIIEWKITNENKYIGSYQCTKATGIFAGRAYTAWFNKNLGLTGAPWKLQGLPGLVFEVEDSKGEVRFSFAGFVQPVIETVAIQFPKGYVKTTTEEYEKLLAAIRENPNEAMSKAVKESEGRREPGVPMPVVDLSLPGAIGPDGKIKPPSISNPLELKGAK